MSIHDATKQIGDCRLSWGGGGGEARQTKSLVDLDPEGYIDGGGGGSLEKDRCIGDL